MQSLQANTLPPDLQQALQLAFEYRRGGRVAEAEKVYRQSLALYPRHPLLLGALGEMQLQAGDATAALPMLDAARCGAPDHVQHWLLYAQCLIALDRGKEAKKILSEAIARGIRHPMLDDLLKQIRSGKKKSAKPIPLVSALEQLDVLFRSGKYDAVHELADQMQARYPKSARLWYLSGMAAMYLGHRPEALAAFERVVELDPAWVEVYLNLAQVLHFLERDEAAVAVLEKAVRLRPDYVEAYQDMGHSLRVLGRAEQAVEVYRTVAELKPDDPATFSDMGHALQLLGRSAEAEDAYRVALSLTPDDPAVLQELAKVQKSAFKYEAALTSLRQAAELEPDAVEVLHDLARTLVEMGSHVEAEEVYRRVLTIEPDGAFLTNSDMLLNFNYRADIRAEALLNEARAYGEKAERIAKHHQPHPNGCSAERRLRVGLVSCDLGMHSVGYFLLNVVASIDPDKVELYAFEIGKRKDPINDHLRQHIPFWRDIAGPTLTDEAAANLIRADNIDILIDLNGHTGDNRLPVFAWKPAPVQLTWLGYLGSTGLNAMDYILADRYALPPGEENHFTEVPWRMPGSYICFTPPTVPVDVGALPALVNGYITFGSFNNLNKINERVVACWAGVLHKVPQSKLYLKTKILGDPEMRAKITASFARHDITADRLVLEGAISSHEEHFRAYQKVDIAIDPYPYPGITTSVEALWMGVPVLTLAGDRFISHQGEAINHHIGLAEWIAADEREYIAKAADFAGDLQSLAALRAGLRERLLASPLCDAPRFARDFEAALQSMWRIWCEQQDAART